MFLANYGNSTHISALCFWVAALWIKTHMWNDFGHALINIS
jgi:hypothetical protein